MTNVRLTKPTIGVFTSTQLTDSTNLSSAPHTQTTRNSKFQYPSAPKPPNSLNAAHKSHPTHPSASFHGILMKLTKNATADANLHQKSQIWSQTKAISKQVAMVGLNRGAGRGSRVCSSTKRRERGEERETLSAYGDASVGEDWLDFWASGPAMLAVFTRVSSIYIHIGCHMPHRMHPKCEVWMRRVALFWRLLLCRYCLGLRWGDQKQWRGLLWNRRPELRDQNRGLSIYVFILLDNRFPSSYKFQE